MNLFDFFFQCRGDNLNLHSFPTRRSSDLPPSHARVNTAHAARNEPATVGTATQWARRPMRSPRRMLTSAPASGRDRKSTRLNSSHVKISYAVFCLKKKNIFLQKTVEWQSR